MADDKQLTVAELLARNTKKRGDKAPSDSSRRRRRRSLDEGGISVAELTGDIKKVEATPPESKHSDEPMDKPAPVIPAPKNSDEDADAETATAAETTGTIRRVERPEPKAAESEASAAEETTVLRRVERPAEDADTASQWEHAQRENAQWENAQASPSAARAASAAAPVAEPDPDPAWNSPQDAETGEMPVVPDTEANPSTAGERTAEVATDDHSVELESTDAEENGAEDEKLNPVAVVLLAIVGIALGILVFLGFEALWARLPKAVVGLLGLAVTGAMVGLAHALRTDRDSLSMVLAAIVGLVLTFGPMLLVF